MLNRRLSKSAEKFIAKLPPKQQRQVADRLEELRHDATPHDTILLKGSKDTYRNTIGEYRIIYRFDLETLEVSIIEKRDGNRAYRMHKRLQK